MGSNPINLAFRFLLEIVALGIYAYRGWMVGEGLTRYLLAVLFPVLGAVVWGVFRVPDDPSSSGDAPIKINGWLRLILEFAIFGAAVWAFFSVEARGSGIIFGSLVILHYLLSWDRILWLLRQ